MLRWIGDLYKQDPKDIFTVIMNDNHAQVVFFTTYGFGGHGERNKNLFIDMGE